MRSLVATAMARTHYFSAVMLTIRFVYIWHLLELLSTLGVCLLLVLVLGYTPVSPSRQKRPNISKYSLCSKHFRWGFVRFRAVKKAKNAQNPNGNALTQADFYQGSEDAIQAPSLNIVDLFSFWYVHTNSSAGSIAKLLF